MDRYRLWEVTQQDYDGIGCTGTHWTYKILKGSPNGHNKIFGYVEAESAFGAFRFIRSTYSMDKFANQLFGTTKIWLNSDFKDTMGLVDFINKAMFIDLP